MRLTITNASFILRLWDDWQEAILETDEAHALEVIHSLVRNYTRIDSATMGFAAGLYYGKRQERERRRFKVQ